MAEDIMPLNTWRVPGARLVLAATGRGPSQEFLA